MLGGDANREIDLKYSGGPMSYSLDYDRATHELIIELVPEFRQCLNDPELAPPAQQIKWYESMVHTTYIPHTETVWGFGPVLTWKSRGTTDCIKCRIPPMNENVNRWAISTSLELLFSTLKFWSPPERPERQLMVIDGMIITGNEGFGRAGIGAYFTPEATTWIRQQPVGPDLEVTEEIRSLFPGDDQAHARSVIDLRYDYSGSLLLKVAENCACLHTIHSGSNSPYIQLDSHNIDSPYQQLSLLVGLAALNTKIRKALEEKK